jgi:hypothetical protein
MCDRYMFPNQYNQWLIGTVILFFQVSTFKNIKFKLFQRRRVSWVLMVDELEYARIVISFPPFLSKGFSTVPRFTI